MFISTQYIMFFPFFMCIFMFVEYRKKTAMARQRAATIPMGTVTRKANTLKAITTAEDTAVSTFLQRISLEWKFHSSSLYGSFVPVLPKSVRLTNKNFRKPTRDVMG